MIKAKLGFFLFFVISFWIQNSRAQNYEPITNWYYVPVNVQFWQQFDELRGEQNLKSAIGLVNEQFQKTKDLEAGESKLALAILLSKLNSNYLASRIILEILEQFPGSMPALRGLVLLDEMNESTGFYEEDIGQVLNLGNFKKIPQQSLSLVSFFVGMDNLKRGLPKWGFDSLSKVVPTSYWGKKIAFYNALLMIKANHLDGALNSISQLIDSSSAFPEFTNKLILQQARLFFELNRYDEAEQAYAKISNLSRETGRALLERAWIRFHQKDYSMTLGILESLKSPFYTSSITPEQYVLAMLAYKELCYYSAVRKIASEYTSTFGPDIEDIRKNIPLAKNQVLMKMTLQDAQLQSSADFVGRLRQEQTYMPDAAGKFSKKVQTYIDQITKRDRKNTISKVEHMVQSNLRVQSEYLLKMTEQVKLIEYLSGLDEFRAKSMFENRKYASENVDHLAIDKLYWPAQKEFWSEELNNYKVLLHDRCHSSGESK